MIKLKENEESYNSMSGLTLIEICIIILLLSLVLLPILNIISIERKAKNISAHNGTTVDLSTALVDYALEHGAYPLPAGPTLPMNNALVFSPVTGGAIPTACTNSGTAGTSGVICRPQRATDLTVTRQVYVGTLPVSVLGLPPEKGLDQYGRKLTYAVTRILTNPLTFSNSGGAIIIADTTGTEKTAPSNRAHFVILSHGADGIGGYNANGTLIGGALCPTNLESGNARQCKSGGTQRAGYFQALYNNSGRLIRATNEATGGTYYDDSLSFKTTTNGRLWTPRDDGINQNEYFTAGRNVGIGFANNTASPSQALTLATGNVRATGTLKTPKLCNTTNTRCFKPDDVDTPPASAPLYCGSSYGLRSIAYTGSAATRTCDTFSVLSTSIPTCSNGISGIDSAGNPICAP